MNDEIKEILEYIRKWMGLSEIPMIVKLEDYITNLEQVNKNQAKRNSRQRLANTKQQELTLKLQQQINNLNKFIKEYGNYLDSLHLDDKGIVYRAREKWNLLLKGIDDNVK